MTGQEFPTIRSSRACIALALLITATALAYGQHERVIHTFRGGSDGANPYEAALVSDASGNLYGTTANGGATTSACGTAGCGTVFELVAPATLGGLWHEKVLYRFQGGADGANPYASLRFDAAGNLYGTTYYGGTGTCMTLVPPFGCGTVFRLMPPATAGGSWTESVLYSFQGGLTDGYFPGAGVIVDRAGNLFGTTYLGVTLGIVFQLSPPSTVGGAWTETILHNFPGYPYGDGAGPNSDLIVDAKGNLYGSTGAGGNVCTEPGDQEGSCGTVFQLSPPATKGGAWTESVLFEFSSTLYPVGLAADKQGNLYGVNYYAGTGPCFGYADYLGGCGEVFQLTPPAVSGGAWLKNSIYSFTGGSDGAFPTARVILSSNGKIYGTTSAYSLSCPASYNGCGAVFSLNPPTAPGGAWTETTLHQFGGNNDGATPWSGLLIGKYGIFGTTYSGGTSTQCGTSGCGVAFQIVP